GGQALAEAGEVDPGMFVTVNDNDSDGDGTVDLNDTDVPSDPDIVRVEISMTPAGGVSGQEEVSLAWTTEDNRVKVYGEGSEGEPDKEDELSSGVDIPVGDLPCNVYVEGRNASGALRDLVFVADTTCAGLQMEDRIRATVIDVDIKQDGSVISGTTHSEIVGKRISLTGEVLPTGLSVSNEQWTIPGERIADFYVGPHDANEPENSYVPGEVVELTDLSDSSTSFYWVDGADGREVTYDVTVEGRPFQAVAIFDVKRPTATMDCTTGHVVVHEEHGDWFAALRFGDPTIQEDGIRFECTVNVPQGFTGSTCFVQLYSLHHRLRDDSPLHLWQYKQGSGLDHTFPYAIGTITEDSPGLELYDGDDMAEVDDSATMWFMFKPSVVEGDAIWVPLRKVDWWWQALAVKDGDEWELDSGANSVDPESTDTTEFPEWTSNIEDTLNDDWQWE
ncbi:MAG: hypothetical protein R6X33_07440, partial [Candidatus Brocadiia bacterium]